ncbi:hypothetical protein ACF3N0_08760 [Moraxella atlantae]|uniref:hypothetical protein n=1 Tax=Faucicola atlantae TaxID=34059 RepID=UPI0037531FA3
MPDFELNESGILDPQAATAALDAALNGETVGFDVPDEAADHAADVSDAQDTTDSSATPAATDAVEPKADELSADNAVILARDGKHTIPFEKLQQAREAERKALQVAQLAEQQAAQANAELEKLRQQLAQTNSAKEQAKVDNQIDIAQQAIESGIDPSIFGDFDEEGLAKGIAQLVNERATKLVDEKLAQALAPLNQKQQIDEAQQHFSAILSAHPDVESVAESQEFADWIDKQPSYTKQAIASVLESGSAQQVIEVLNQFKAAKPAPQAQNQADIKQAAKEKLSNTTPNIPASLSDIAGGQTHTSPDDRLAAMNSVDMLSEMESWSQEQIDRFLNKL